MKLTNATCTPHSAGKCNQRRHPFQYCMWYSKFVAAVYWCHALSWQDPEGGKYAHKRHIWLVHTLASMEAWGQCKKSKALDDMPRWCDTPVESCMCTLIVPKKLSCGMAGSSHPASHLWIEAWETWVCTVAVHLASSSTPNHTGYPQAPPLAESGNWLWFCLNSPRARPMSLHASALTSSGFLLFAKLLLSVECWVLM